MTHPPTPNPLAERSLRAPVLWGVVWGVIQAAAPLGFWWLDPATVYALSLALIAAVYIGFAVADGRPRVIAVETVVAAVFVVVAAAGVTGPAWLRWPAWLAMGSRTCGSTGATLSPTPAGGRRSAWSSTGSRPPSWWCCSPSASTFTDRRWTGVDFLRCGG
jgi:hypothetical protein